MEVAEDVTLALVLPFLGVAPVFMLVDWFLGSCAWYCMMRLPLSEV